MPRTSKASLGRHATTPQIELVEVEINEETGRHRMVLRFPTFDGLRTCALPREDLAEPKAVLRAIMQQGALSMGLDDVRQQCMKLATQRPPKTVRTTSVTGWYGSTLVTRHGEFGEIDADAPVRFHAEDRARSSARQGTLGAYKRSISGPLKASNYLTFFLCAALAAPLGAYVRRPGAMTFCLTQESTAGKSLTGRVMLSVSRNADETELESLNMTDGKSVKDLQSFGGEAIAFADVKSSQSKGGDLARQLQTLVFSARDGSQRKTLTTAPPPVPNFSILVFSAERPVKDLFHAAGLPFEDGDAVRFCDIPVPPRAEGGIFDNRKRAVSSVDLAREVEAALAENYGFFLPKWASILSKLSPREVSRLVDRMERYFSSRLGPLPDPLEQRLSRNFAFVAACGVLAVAAGLLPVTPRHVIRAAQELFYRARGRLSSKSMKEAATLKSVRRFLVHLPSVSVGKGANPDDIADGFRRGSEVFIRSQALDHLVENKNTLSRLMGQWKEAHIVRIRGGKLTAPVQQAGLPRQRYYRLDAKRLEEWLSSDIGEGGDVTDGV